MNIIIKNIDWAIDLDLVKESIENLDEDGRIELAKLIDCPDLFTYTKEDQMDIIMDKFHHFPALLDKYWECPEEVTLPPVEEMYENTNAWDEELITDFLTSTYGTNIGYQGYDICR